ELGVERSHVERMAHDRERLFQVGKPARLHRARARVLGRAREALQKGKPLRILLARAIPKADPLPALLSARARPTARQLSDALARLRRARSLGRNGGCRPRALRAR